MNISKNNFNKTKQILSVLKNVSEDECREVMSDYDFFLNQVKRLLDIQALQVHFDEAEKCFFKKNNHGEKISLLSALHEINSKQISDREFTDAGFRNYLAKRNVTVDKIEIRLKELGWYK
ncbi:MAG: hypothetical protein ACFCU6_10060 [Balneolaceae bacterium]